MPRGSGRGRLRSGEPEGGRAAGGPAPRQDGGRRPRGRPGRGGRRAVAGAAGRGTALLPLGPGGGAQGECRSPSGPVAARCLGAGERRGPGTGGDRREAAPGTASPRPASGGAGGGRGRAARFVLGGGGGGEQEGSREHARVSAPLCCAPRLS